MAHGHGFDPVWRRVERGYRKLLVELFQLAPHVVPELGVEVDDRLVHQEYARLAHEHAPQGRALPLTTAELGRGSIQQLLDLEHHGDAVDLES